MSIINSRSRKKLRREIALKNRITQLENWKNTPTGEHLSKERKMQKILIAENEIKILQARV